MKRGVEWIFLILLIIGMFEFISAGGGGASVSVTSVELTEQSTDYIMKPGRLKFEFNENLYAIQVRKINGEEVTFLIMTLDMNEQKDVTAYIIDDSFNLKSGEYKEIDLDKNGISDILIELKKITLTGKYNSLKGADFSINRINAKKEEIITSEFISIENITENEISETELEPVLILNRETKNLTFFERIANWIKGAFN